MKVLLFFTLCFVVTMSTAATYFHELTGYASIGTTLKIVPQGGKRHGPPAYMRFVIVPFNDSAAATLEIGFSDPATEPNGSVGYSLRRDGIDLVAENYIQHGGNYITLDLPALKADEAIEFRIGWRGGGFPYRKVQALLTTEHGKKSASWVSREIVALFPPHN